MAFEGYKDRKAGRALGRQMNQYNIGQMDKLLGGQMVSDKEKDSMKAESVDSAGQLLQAQQSQANRMAAANTGGSSLLAGQAAKGAIAGAEGGADAMVKATGTSQRNAMSLEEQRKAQALSNIQAQEQANIANRQRVKDSFLRAGDSVVTAIGNIFAGG